MVLVPRRPLAEALDEALWAEPEPDWLPHGAFPPDDPRAALCPVWITADDALAAAGGANRATFLFLMDGAPTRHAERFERVFDLFDGGSAPAVELARSRWREARSSGGAPDYWRETPSGWEQVR